MIIIPAIDIHKGNCVMLTEGKLENEKIYSTDPVFIAKLWCAKGADRLHIVDLDGAFIGIVQNFEILKQIRKSVNCPIEFGGGIRNKKIISQLIKIGIDKIILGTVAVYNPKLLEEAIKKYSEKIMVAIDIVDTKIAIAGWKELTQTNYSELISRIENLGIKEVIITDVQRDGTLKGIDTEGLKQKLAVSNKFQYIISGGVSSLDDIVKLKELQSYGLKGVIVGKALYEETIKFEEATKICQEQK